MAWDIPNEASATWAPQSHVDTVDLDALVAGINKIGVIESGGAVTAPAVAGRTVDVAAGAFHLGTGSNSSYPFAAAASLAIAAPSAFDRKDIIVATASAPGVAAVAVVQGTASTGTTNGVTAAGNRDPVKPNIPANSVLLAEIYVPVNLVNIAAGHIVDKRILIEPASIIMAKSANYTAISGDVLLVDASGASRTITLPAVAVGKEVMVKRTDNTPANNVTVTPASGTIDGFSSWVLNMQYEAIRVISDGTNWFVV